MDGNRYPWYVDMGGLFVPLSDLSSLTLPALGLGALALVALLPAVGLMWCVAFVLELGKAMLTNDWQIVREMSRRIVPILIITVLVFLCLLPIVAWAIYYNFFVIR